MKTQHVPPPDETLPPKTLAEILTPPAAPPKPAKVLPFVRNPGRTSR